ncbi:MAG: hypothetical protein K6F68_07665 [Clostridiales bacterium]|nr:hypothetical protein [Clostridiales bacterium]
MIGRRRKKSVLTSLILTSGCGCSVERGGNFYGVSDPVPLILPALENETVFITAWGRKDSRAGFIPVPRLISIVIENGMAVSSDVPVINWGDVIEAEAEPLFIRESPKTGPGILDTAEISFGEGRVRAELFYDNGLNIAYSRDGARPVSVALGEGESGSLRPLDVGSARYLTVKAVTRDGQRLIILDRDAVTALDARGNEAFVADGYPTVIERLRSVRCLERRTRFSFEKGGFAAMPAELGFFRRGEHIPESDAERAVSIAEELILGYEDRWRELLAPELADALQGDTLKNFLGEYDSVRAHPVEEREGRVTVGLFEKTDSVMTPRKFLFVFEGGLLSDVEEL